MVPSASAARSRRGITVVSLAALCGLALPSAAFIFVPTAQSASRETRVRLLTDRIEREWGTQAGSVAEALAEAQISLGPHDEVTPPVTSPLLDGMTIQVVRVTREEVTHEEKLSYRTVFRRVTRRYQRAPTITVPGKPGLIRRSYEVIRRDGIEVGRRPLRYEIVQAPVDQVVSLHHRAPLPSRGYFRGRRVFRMMATAYDPGPASCGRSADGITAIGLRAGKGVVAVDPRVIPLRSRLYIEGYGLAIAGDVGSAIKGHRIDLGYNSRRAALNFGRRRVTVWVLD